MKPDIIIVDYAMGNIQSVRNAFETLGQPTRVCSHPREFGTPNAIVLPGVGAFPEAMDQLHRRELLPQMNDLVINRQTPVLGICLGMQLFASGSEEGGKRTAGLGWIPGEVVRIEASPRRRVPHVGWNSIEFGSRKSLLLKDDLAGQNFYFDHSFHFQTASEHVSGLTEYEGKQFVSIVERDNITGVQFHPEKSQRSGLKLLRSFLNSLLLDCGL